MAGGESQRGWRKASAQGHLLQGTLIEGWIIAIQQMHIGDKWELYIPAEMGYGKFSQPGIPGGSTLIFEIELLGIA